MKHSIIILFFLSITSCFAQNKETRIQEIKKMYAEIVELNNANAVKDCKNGKIMEETKDNNNQAYPMEQTATFCKVSEVYSTYSGQFSGHEWNFDLSVYLQNNKVFFISSSSNAESYADQYRLYYNTAGKVIKILHTSNNGEDMAPEDMKTQEITDKKEIARITAETNLEYKKTMKIVGK